MCKGAGQAFKFVAKADHPARPPLFPADPIDEAQARQADWEVYWDRGKHYHVEEYVACLRRLIALAGPQAAKLPALTPNMLRAALKSFKAHRGRAFDTFNPEEMAQLPDAALQHLCTLYQLMERSLAVPATALAALIVMLPEPKGGFRPIGLISMVYALWVKARRGYIRQFDADKAGFWDTAIAGSSALQAALRRKLSDEVAIELERPTATLLWDLEKFYDSVVLHRVITAAADLDYPLVHLALGMQVHMAPRFIRSATGCFSTGMRPDTSMLAGDGQSNAWARCALYDMLEHVHDKFGPTVVVNSYVDDLAQRGEAASEDHLVDQVVSAAELLYNRVNRSELKFSDAAEKSTQLLASSSRIAQRISSRLGRLGISHQVVKKGQRLRDWNRCRGGTGQPYHPPARCQVSGPPQAGQEAPQVVRQTCRPHIQGQPVPRCGVRCRSGRRQPHHYTRPQDSLCAVVPLLS